jgi:CRP-like cAMP-binding protein
MKAARLKVLQNMPIFGAIREDILEILLESATITEFAAEDYIFREDDIGMSLFVLEEGQAHVTKLLEGHEYIVHTLNPGDCFGEMALIDMGPRSANVVCLKPCRTIEIFQHHLLAIYKHDIEQFTLVQMNMAREVCRRLRKADRQLFTSRTDFAELPKRGSAK